MHQPICVINRHVLTFLRGDWHARQPNRILQPFLWTFLLLGFDLVFFTIWCPRVVSVGIAPVPPRWKRKPRLSWALNLHASKARATLQEIRSALCNILQESSMDHLAKYKEGNDTHDNAVDQDYGWSWAQHPFTRLFGPSWAQHPFTRLFGRSWAQHPFTRLFGRSWAQHPLTGWVV